MGKHVRGLGSMYNLKAHFIFARPPLPFTLWLFNPSRLAFRNACCVSLRVGERGLEEALIVSPRFSQRTKQQPSGPAASTYPACWEDETWGCLFNGQQGLYGVVSQCVQVASSIQW